MKPEIARLLEAIRRGEDMIKRGAPMAIQRNVAIAKMTYKKLKKLRCV